MSAFSFDATPARRLGAAGWAAVQQALDLTVIALAGEQAGGARRILELTIEYLKTRVQFGRPIGSIIGERVLGLPKEPEVDRNIPFRDVRGS